MSWEADSIYYEDFHRWLEQVSDDNQRAREQDRRDDRTRDHGESGSKVCGQCGRLYWSAGAHWEECNGVKAA